MHSYRSRTEPCRETETHTHTHTEREKERERERERWVQRGRERERMPVCCARVYVCMLSEKLNEISSVELQMEKREEE